MKYALILLDGMADYPITSLGGKTPLEFARTPMMDRLAKTSQIGLVRTVPHGFKPGSDVANLGVLGYDVHVCYTGRSPLEALSMGIEMQDDDLALRANLVTLSDDMPFEDKIMLDYSAGEITTEESQTLIKDLASQLNIKNGSLYAGVSYRHCLIINHAKPNETLTPPHDITAKRIEEYMPKGELGEFLTRLIKESYDFLKNHPINKARISRGKSPANALWFWGEGTKPHIERFESKYGKRGAMISAVDLLKGIAIGGGMQSVDVDGATGTIDTNFDGKAAAAIRALEKDDFCMVHLEAPDECGHQGDLQGKIRAIELIDEKIIAPIFAALSQKGEFAMLVMPDHYTPVSKRTHTSEPVPYMLYNSGTSLGTHSIFSEKEAQESGILLDNPWYLTNRFFLQC